MINFYLDKFLNGLRALTQALAHIRNIPTEDEHKDVLVSLRPQIEHNVNAAMKDCYVGLRIEAAHQVCVDIEALFHRQRYTWRELGTLVEEFWRTLEHEMKFEQFHHYSRSSVKLIHSIYTEWKPTAEKFKTTAVPEIEDGLDCLAVGRPTAAIFHMMRVAEHGLRALARTLNVTFPKTGTPIEWAEWQNLIDQIGANGRREAAALPQGEQREAARDFYSGSVHHFEGFKDKYRNAVMHTRARYDAAMALQVVGQVRDFMNGLSAKIGEKTKTPIRRWP